MEKIKDIIYNYSDILLGVIIAIAMFIVISFSLGSWFSDDSHSIVQASVITDPQVETTSPITNLPELQEDEVEDPIEDPIEVDSEVATEVEEETPTATVVVLEPTTSEVMTITIPNGTPGVGIAGILVDNGLIEDRQTFIQLAEELNLALRLKSGTFEIPVNASVEEIIRIISGTN